MPKLPPSAPVSVSVDGAGRDPGLEMALAMIVALVPGAIIKRVAAQLEQLRELRTHGGVDVKFNSYDGRVESADFSMRSRWRIPEAERNRARES